MCEDKLIEDSDLDLLTLWVVWNSMIKVQEYLSANDESGQAEFGHALCVVQDLIDAKEKSEDSSTGTVEEDHF